MDKLELMFDSRNAVGMVLDGWVLRPGYIPLLHLFLFVQMLMCHCYFVLF